ncbi:MAG: 50S ribosomal protein L2 [Nanoarchaeota archaeon]|nr:50S ribosomal protein L2 [Nanoarchaeota archaeon]
MGKNLTQQKRGRGTTTYRAPSFRYKGKAAYPRLEAQIKEVRIIDIVHCAGHSTPLIEFMDGSEKKLTQAPEGIAVNDTISIGKGAAIKSGNIVPLEDIPEGTSIFNIEGTPGDGGKFVRTSGGAAKILTKKGKNITVQLPSKKERIFLGSCRATIGNAAGAGRKEKPYLKAGIKFMAMKAKNKKWPIVSGTSMNAVDHPFGGSSTSHKGKPTTTSRNAPPGRKVGKIAARRTGRRNSK